jgi:hypothetical protein
MVDLDAFTAHSKKVTDKLLTQTYKAFLTDLELHEVIHGRELWLTADDVRERLARRQEYLEVSTEEFVEAPPEPQPKKPTRKKKEPSQA